MANEAILRDRFSDAVDFTCIDVNIPVGTILKLSGARGVAPATADNDVFIGIAAREKIAGDGRSTIAVYLDGIFDCTFDSTVTAGSQVVVSGANILKAYTTLDDEKGYVVGKVIETVTNAGGVMQVIVGRVA